MVDSERRGLGRVPEERWSLRGVFIRDDEARARCEVRKGMLDAGRRVCRGRAHSGSRAQEQ